MLAQHWATCWCCRPSVGQRVSAAGDSPLFQQRLVMQALITQSETVGICGIKCCIMHTVCVNMAINDMEIKLV